MSIHPIILHIPHDSIVIPPEERQKILLNDEELAKELIFITDSHTDELYQFDTAERVVFPVSRLLLDPERFSDDSQEPMAARGMGVIYTITSQLGQLREQPTEEERQDLLDTYYHPHHETLTRKTDEAVEAFDKCLIVDCHSFPSKTLPYEMKDGTESRPEICIGTDSFHTPPEIKVLLEEFFKDAGYGVDIDTPFAGALTPLKHYAKDSRVMSVMYEIRRDLYMDEVTGEKNDNFAKVQSDITQSIALLKDKLF